MKIVRTVVVLDKGKVIDSEQWQLIHTTYTGAIKSIVHPPGSKEFTLRRKSRKVSKKGKPTNQWNRNGVTTIKNLFLEAMARCLWQREQPLSLKDLAKKYGESLDDIFLEYPQKTEISEPLHSTVGDLDCHFKIDDKWRAAIEWETGNISSSHRSMNKLCLALMAGQIEVAVLIVPSRNMYPHLTDRVGNWMELSPYLAFWRKLSVHINRGLLAVTVVEQDADTDDPAIPYIGQGKDGRSAEGASKLK